MQIIGEGERGIVLYPSISGCHDMVSKLSTKSELMKEINNIMMLPDNQLFKLPKNVTLKKVPQEILSFIEENDDTMYGYYIDLPYIKGEHPNFEEITPELKNAYDEFVLNVERLHEQGFCHCSIFPSNIIFSEGKLYLIDFGTIRKIDEDNWKSVECEDLLNLLSG